MATAVDKSTHQYAVNKMLLVSNRKNRALFEPC